LDRPRCDHFVGQTLGWTVSTLIDLEVIPGTSGVRGYRFADGPSHDGSRPISRESVVFIGALDLAVYYQTEMRSVAESGGSQ
jgi:hypothetical protein